MTLVHRNAFLYEQRNIRPFTAPLFLQVVSEVQGINRDIPGPTIAFVAFKVAQLLAAKDWNVPGARLDNDDDEALYNRFLKMTSEMHKRTVGPKNPPEEFGEMWVRIIFDAKVRCQLPTLCPT